MKDADLLTEDGSEFRYVRIVLSNYALKPTTHVSIQ